MEQDGSMLNPHLKQEQAAESWFLQHSQPQTTEGSKSSKKQSGPPHHAVIGARPFCSPEYSPDFYKLGSTLPHSTYSFTSSSTKSNTSIPHQSSNKTRMSYSEKRRLLDKQKEMEEVKQLDEWRPTVSIFTTLLDGLNDKAN
ncbi:spermatogenesis-associated serine-rich protein 1 isoform X3 [Larimichthys crocea]|uniref:spermatogenesis-associated serine-rich protein 1 isoform X3 n=1 Tax=Larimichthys crocea TaxID=215358 RepID=UPI0009012030|nr:spermatogenesis-associated serine-rich protein 1 isoform X3 [Larimichthys crocea]